MKSVHIHNYPPPEGESRRLEKIETLLIQLIKYMPTLKKDIMDAAAAEKKELLEGIEANVEAAVKKALAEQGLSPEDQEDIITEIRGIFTPEGGTQMSRTALVATFKGEEPGPIRQSLVGEDNSPALGELWRENVAQPFLTALDEPFTSKNHPIEVSFSLVQDGKPIAEKSGTFDLAQVLNAQLAAVEGQAALIRKQIAGEL